MSYLSVGAISGSGGGGLGPRRKVVKSPPSIGIVPFKAGGRVGIKAVPARPHVGIMTAPPPRPHVGIMTAPPPRPHVSLPWKKVAKIRATVPIVASSVLTTSSLTTTQAQIAPSIGGAVSKGGGSDWGGFETAEDPVMADLNEDEVDTADVSKKGGGGIILLALGAGVLYLLMK